MSYCDQLRLKVETIKIIKQTDMKEKRQVPNLKDFFHERTEYDSYDHS